MQYKPGFTFDMLATLWYIFTNIYFQMLHYGIKFTIVTYCDMWNRIYVLISVWCVGRIYIEITIYGYINCIPTLLTHSINKHTYFTQ